MQNEKHFVAKKENNWNHELLKFNIPPEPKILYEMYIHNTHAHTHNH